MLYVSGETMKVRYSCSSFPWAYTALALFGGSGMSLYVTSFPLSFKLPYWVTTTMYCTVDRASSKYILDFILSIVREPPGPRKSNNYVIQNGNPVRCNGCDRQTRQPDRHHQAGESYVVGR